MAPPFQTILLTYGLIMAIAALGFNLLLGYTGLLSFGHAAYFGVGAYTVGLLIKYFSVMSLEVQLLAALASSGLVAAAFGFLCVRHTRIYFAILTLALAQVLWSLTYKFWYITGGSDGLRIPTPQLLGIDFAATMGKLRFLADVYYYFVLAVFVASALVMWLVVSSPFGKTLQAIRDNETRAEFVGIRIRKFRWMAFTISGIYTGLAGALWAPLNGHTAPDIMYWLFSGEIVFLTVLGGFRVFAGPILGALVFVVLKTYAIGFTIYWQLVLGIVLVLLILAMPTGLMGALGLLTTKIKRVATT